MSVDKPRLEDLRIERKPPRRRGYTAYLAFLAILAVIAAVALGLWERNAGAVEVQTALVRETAAGTAHTVLNASGYVTARREATVSSKVTGKVTEVLIEEGMKVKEGQILARLDDTNIRTGLEVAQAQLESAQISLEETRALLKQAQNEYNRATELAKQNITSQSDLDKAESDATSLQARLARQERDAVVADKQVKQWQQQMEDMIIRAPFDGVVTTKDAQPGEMISPVSAGGGFTRTGIGTVVDMQSLEIEIDVNESYINRVEAGQAVEATLDAYPDWTIPCKVIAIIPTADRQKSTVKVRVGFDKLDPKILPEMSVKVAFREGGTTEAPAVRTMIVPKNALQHLDDQDVVFVVQGDHAERHTVTVSGTQDNDAILSAGVSGGEHVILDSPPNLKDGAAVKEKKP
jgi:RND family efflux transporter MFP subunit